MTRLPDGYTLRIGTTDDLDVIVAHRRCMFDESISVTPELLDTMERSFRAWVIPEMEAGNWRQWLIEAGGAIVAGTALWVHDYPPGTTDTSSRRATLFNVFTEPDHRRRGLGRALVAAAIASCRDEGLHIVDLHASDQGRALYAAMGFTQSREMRLVLSEQQARATDCAPR